MEYTLGLDIGIASIGWAVLANDINGDPYHIQKNEDAPTTNNVAGAELRGLLPDCSNLMSLVVVQDNFNYNIFP